MSEFELDNAKETNVETRVRVPAGWNALTSRIPQAAMAVHSEIGPGLLEELYEDALCFDSAERTIAHQRQWTLPIPYKSIVLRRQRCDILVEGLVALGLRSFDKVGERHLAAMVGCMRVLDAPLGLLLNFNQMRRKEGIFRRINPRSSRFSNTSPPAST